MLDTARVSPKLHRLVRRFLIINLYTNYTVNNHTIQVNNFILYGTRYGIRTHVNAVKGHDPRPLDEPSVRNRRQLELFSRH